MDINTIRALRPQAETYTDLAAALDAARAARQEAEAEALRLTQAIPGMLLGDATEAQITKAERAAASATATADMIARLLPDLEARLDAARKREAGARLSSLRAAAEAASAEAAAAWQAEYPGAAATIAKLLRQAEEAEGPARTYAAAVAAAIQTGDVEAADAIPANLATINLFGPGIGDLVQLPATDGRLRVGAYWMPADLMRETWRERRMAQDAAQAEAEARQERERAAQAELDQRIAAMSPHQRRTMGCGPAVKVA